MWYLGEDGGKSLPHSLAKTFTHHGFGNASPGQKNLDKGKELSLQWLIMKKRGPVIHVSRNTVLLSTLWWAESSAL